MALADRIPLMGDWDLASLRANAAHMADHGSLSQMMAAGAMLPLIDAEAAKRACKVLADILVRKPQQGRHP